MQLAQLVLWVRSCHFPAGALLCTASMLLRHDECFYHKFHKKNNRHVTESLCRKIAEIAYRRGCMFQPAACQKLHLFSITGLRSTLVDQDFSSSSTLCTLYPSASLQSFGNGGIVCSSHAGLSRLLKLLLARRRMASLSSMEGVCATSECSPGASRLQKASSLHIILCMS